MKITSECISYKGIIKVLGVLITLLLIAVGIFIILVVSAGLTNAVANQWAIKYLVTYFIDFFVLELIVILLKLFIYPKVKT